MHIDWRRLTGELLDRYVIFRGGGPEVMNGFSAIAQAALKTNVLDAKTRS